MTTISLSRSSRRFALAFASAVVFVAAPARAQQGAGVLVGKARSALDQSPLADVVVTATSPALQGEQVVVTDASGSYRLPNLPPGEYTLHFEAEKFRPYDRTGVALRADVTLRVDVLLMPEAVQAETVTVTAAAPTVDVGSSTTGLNVDREFTARIPVAAPVAKGGGVRSFEAVAEVVPGARNDEFGASINGTSSPENQYVIDGLSTNNPGFGVSGAPLSVEFVREVNVITGGYMPEYGRATGGTLNVVTKQGSNEFHGGVWINTNPGAFEAPRRRVRRLGNTVENVTSLNHVGDFGVDLGGPILKDRLWFYAGFMVAQSSFNLDRTINARAVDGNGEVLKDPQYPPYDLTSEVARRRFRASREDTQAIGKLTWTLDPQNRITLTVLALPSVSGGDGTYGVEPRSGKPEVDVGRGSDAMRGAYGALAHQYVSEVLNGTLKWTTQTKDKSLLLDTTVGWHHQYDSLRAADGTRVGEGGLAATAQTRWRRTNPGAHSVTDFEGVPGGPGAAACDPPGTAAAVLCPTRTYVTGGPGQLSEKWMDRVELRSVLTYLAEGLGHHVAKAGIDVEGQWYANDRGFSGGTIFRESTSGTRFDDFRQVSYMTGPDQPVVLRSIRWDTRSYTLGGFVQDSWSVLDKVTINAGLRYDAQLLFGGDGSLFMALPNQWSPRIGAIWDPTYSGRAKIYANFARYYESVPLNLVDRNGSNNFSARARRPASVCDPRDPVQQQGACMDPAKLSSLRDPAFVSDKWTFSGDKTSVARDLQPQSSDEIVLGGEYDVVKNGRIGVFYTKRWMGPVIEDMSRDEATSYFIGNPGYGMARDFPRATREYDAGTLFFTKGFSDDWLAQVSYTLSYLRGNYPGLFRPETTQLDPNINSDFDLKSLMENRSGPLPGDRTHDVKVFVAKDWTLPSSIVVSTGGSFRATSGAPTNVLGSHELYGAYEAFVLPRGSGERLPWQFRVDAHVGLGFRWGKDQVTTLNVDVFNLFDFQATTKSDEEYTQSDVRPIANGTIRDLPARVTRVHGEPFDPAREVNPNFGRPVEYQTPRQFRIGIRTTF